VLEESNRCMRPLIESILQKRTRHLEPCQLTVEQNQTTDLVFQFSVPRLYLLLSLLRTTFNYRRER